MRAGRVLNSAFVSKTCENNVIMLMNNSRDKDSDVMFIFESGRVSHGVYVVEKNVEDGIGSEGGRVLVEASQARENHGSHIQLYLRGRESGGERGAREIGRERERGRERGREREEEREREREQGERGGREKGLTEDSLTPRCSLVFFRDSSASDSELARYWVAMYVNVENRRVITPAECRGEPTFNRRARASCNSSLSSSAVGVGTMGEEGMYELTEVFGV